MSKWKWALKKLYDYFRAFLILFLIGVYFIVPTGRIAHQYVANPDIYQKISIENYLNYGFTPFGSDEISFTHSGEEVVDYAFFRLNFYGVQKLTELNLSQEITLTIRDGSFVAKSSPVLIFVDEAKKTYQKLALSKDEKEISLPSGRYSIFASGHCYWLKLELKDKSLMPYQAPTGFEERYKKARDSND